MTDLNVYIGFDHAESIAYQVAESSLRNVSGLAAQPLVADRLRASGLYWRHHYWRQQGNAQQRYDLPSDAPCSTEFAASRFLVPLLCQSGWALFVDCDIVFYTDPRALLSLADHQKAVMVVKHNHQGKGLKMGGMVQTAYPRKNWSSVMLFNCDHPANQRLSLRDINERPGRQLHAFYWLHDDEIGELPPSWNWLVNVQPRPATVDIAHFTNGGPWVNNWPSAENDYLWLEAARPYDGLDSVPTAGSFLLNQGEQVTTKKTSQRDI